MMFISNILMLPLAEAEELVECLRGKSSKWPQGSAGRQACDEDAAIYSAVLSLRKTADAAKAELAALRARVDVPWKPGLPSVEVVRAHEARGGWWHRRWPADDADLVFSRFCARRPGTLDVVLIVLADGRTGWPVGGGESRPCSSDGTPLPWLEAA